MRYFCCDRRRLEVVRQHGTLNGLEYLEVHDSGIPGDAFRQRTLFLKLLRPGFSLDPVNIRIFGGDRIPTVAVEWTAPANALPPAESPNLVDGLAPLDHFLVLRTTQYGDFSLYTLRLVAGPHDDSPAAGFDPRLVEVRFSFKVACESDFDCKAPAECTTRTTPARSISYLAKDYASFRRLMLDRMSELAPDWRERNPADPGIALVELLAYVGDQLSYQQDATATEAYLGTARRRVSLRRHARLVDYRVHEGCSARAWVRVFTANDGVELPLGTQFLTRVRGLSSRVPVSSAEYRDALSRGAEVFESTDDVVLYPAHARVPFYTWGDRDCCLPAAQTRATLAGSFPKLKAGDVLVFAEEIGPLTGRAEDADPSHRWAVRLTHVRPAEDPSGGLFEEPPHANPVPVTEIEWDARDALPFSLCLSATTDIGGVSTHIPLVSVAYGNIVLADHGRTIAGESLGTVPEPHLWIAPARDAMSCARPQAEAIPPRFRPTLRERPLTYIVPQAPRLLFATEATDALRTDLDAHSFSALVHDWLLVHGIAFGKSPTIQGGETWWSVSDGDQAFVIREREAGLQVYARPQAATQATAADARRARPAITLTSDAGSTQDIWHARFDLLASAQDAREFVVEVEHDRTAVLRFGDDHNGKRPNAGTTFTATYRIGNGIAGNVGAESLAHIVSDDALVAGATNPMPAAGGVEPESVEEIRRDAPEAFRVQERAVTPEDYSDVARRHPGVQRAAASFRWTGSWHTVFLTVDRYGGADVDTSFEEEMRRHVERYRMAGYDLEVDGPRYVPLEIGLRVCVKPDYFRAHVKAALLRVFGRGWLPDGRRAFFHPDSFTFGQTVYLGDLYAAAHSIEGVASAVVEMFQRRESPGTKPLDDGFITMDRLEIARLDNDPSFPERGRFTVSLGGGK